MEFEEIDLATFWEDWSPRGNVGKKKKYNVNILPATEKWLKYFQKQVKKTKGEALDLLVFEFFVERLAKRKKGK